uniref:Ommochrome-binding protein-like n=1 Tax=Heliothis virescens TaxID=7102 RepID=A0A2A4J6D9_HELVI
MTNFNVVIAVLLCFRLCATFDLPRDGCESELKINNNHYNVTDTYQVGDVYPTDAHFDVYGNLFYVETGQNENGYYFNVNVIKFKTDAPQKVQGLPEDASYSIAIDKGQKKVYFGTGRGIFKYNYETHSATPVSSSTFKLDMIFIDKDSNKYVTENNDGIEELYLLDEEMMKKIRFNTLEAINELTIDDKNNFYYIKQDKLFVLKSTLSSPICIGNVSYDGMAQIAVHNNNVFVASDDLLYFHENDTGNLKFVNNAPENVTAIAFNLSGDFVLGVPGKILKYKKNECLFRKSQGNSV